MKNYEEKEKKLEEALKKLNSMSHKVAKMSEDINSLSLEKNQLLREKEQAEKNFQSLIHQHEGLKFGLEKVNKDVEYKFGDKNTFNKKIDELNQETATLIDEIDKWQT